MDHVPAAVEEGGFAEDDVLAVGGYLVLNPFYPLEEYQVDGAAVVPESGYQAGALARAG